MAYKMRGPSFYKESTKGYKSNSPDVNEPQLKINGDKDGTGITMDGVEFNVHGKDNLGNEKIMQPGKNYEFPGDYVIETPLRQKTKEPLYEGDYEEGGLKRDRWKNLDYKAYDKFIPATEEYIMPENWEENGFSENTEKLATYTPGSKTIKYKFRPVPFKDAFYPTEEQKKHENIHHLQEMEGGEGSVINEFVKDRNAHMKKFKSTDNHYTYWDNGAKKNPSGKFSDLPKEWRKKTTTNQRNTLGSKRNIPGTVEHDATVRAKNFGPGY